MRQRSTNYKMMATERNKTITLSGINSSRRGLDSECVMQNTGTERIHSLVNKLKYFRLLLRDSKCNAHEGFL